MAGDSAGPLVISNVCLQIPRTDQASTDWAPANYQSEPTNKDTQYITNKQINRVLDFMELNFDEYI